MRHEEARLLLVDYLQGRLDDEARARVQSHLHVCEECTAAGEIGGQLASIPLSLIPSAKDHPAVDAIVSYATGAGGLGPEAALGIAVHLRTCRACSTDVEAIRRSEVHLGSGSGSRRGVSLPWSWSALTAPVSAAAAAGLALLLLGYPAYLGFSRLPETQRQIEELRTAKSDFEKKAESLEGALQERNEQLRVATGWSGPVPLSVLGSPLRRSSLPATLTVHEGQPYLVLPIQPPVPEGTSGNASCEFAIARAEGPVVWSMSLALADVRAHLESSGVVLFLVPSRLTPPGRYEVTVHFTKASGQGAPRTEERLRIPFYVAEPT